MYKSFNSHQIQITLIYRLQKISKNPFNNIDLFNAGFQGPLMPIDVTPYAYLAGTRAI